ncbi:MAG TPA: heme ABC transporter permease [Gammaproteobacteria bacterium]|nr:heme ABC transporter permease [Gammaproteobacteria bacterium]
MPKFFHQLASPPHFYRIAGPWARWFGWIALVLILAGLYGGLWWAPPDYQQGDGFRIIYIHVPSAWMSLFIYVTMAISAGIGLIWRIKLAHVVAAAAAPIGASFTFLALVTGSLWGKPMWGTYWVWDARLTSELLLLFLYLGYISLNRAFPDQRTGDRASAILALVGVINVPIIHYSVQWWNTLHQGPTVFKAGGPSIAPDMLIPLLVMIVGFMAYFGSVLLVRVRTDVLERERHKNWAQLVVENE